MPLQNPSTLRNSLSIRDALTQRTELIIDNTDSKNCVGNHAEQDLEYEEGRGNQDLNKRTAKERDRTQPRYRYWPPLSFLDLPVAVRTHIYEYLPVHTKYITAHRDSNDKPCVRLLMKYLSRTILQTCRTILNEAEATLEIQTMQLGPPKILATISAIHQVHKFIGDMKRHENEGIYQRLRLSDEHRSDLSSQEIGCLMWTRIALLQQLSCKDIQIGVYLPSRNPPFFSNSQRDTILSDLWSASENIVSYWHPQDWSCPRFWIVVERFSPLAYDQGLESLLWAWNIGIKYLSFECVREAWAIEDFENGFQD